jgi:lipid A 3-O-deacylase
MFISPLTALCITAQLGLMATDTDTHTPIPEQTTIRYDFDASASCVLYGAMRDDEVLPEPSSATSTPPPFGSARSMRWTLQGGAGLDFSNDRNKFATLGAGLSYFIVDDLSLVGEVNVMHFDQRDRDAWGLNANLLVRYHVVSEPTWSFYVDGGAGMLGTTRKVPYDGSQFNFTPQIGAGFSVDIGNDIRLLTGLRWHHISNANTHRDNPGRDSLLGYVGLSMPF